MHNPAFGEINFGELIARAQFVTHPHLIIIGVGETFF